jgi:hypothetical protein
MDIEKILYKKVFVEPLRSGQSFEVIQKPFYSKPTWKKWLSVFEDYNVYYGYSNPQTYNPNYDSWVARNIDVTNTPFDAPLKGLDILDFFSEKYKHRYDNKHLDYLRYRIKKIITCACDIIANEVGNPVPIFTGNNTIDPQHFRIHPFKCLTSAHSILNKPLKTIVFERKKNFVGPRIDLQYKTQVNSLQDILFYYENIPFGFLEIEHNFVSHIHFWCFVNGWNEYADSGFATYPKFDMDKFLGIYNEEQDLQTIFTRGYKECRN